MKRKTIYALLIAFVLIVAIGLVVILKGCRRRPPGRSGDPFAGLPTENTDYTCAGTVPCATWPMPAAPASGAAVSDPVFGTAIYKLGVPADSSTGKVIPMYARVQAWNADGTLMTMADGLTTDLYDATTVPPTPIAQIKLSDGTTLNGIDGDVLWGNTEADRSVIFFNSASGSGHGLELRSVDVSGCAAGNCTLTPKVLHTFSCRTDATSPLGAGRDGNKIETGSGAQGSMFDRSDRYFSFSCDLLDGNGRNEIDLVRWDRESDTVQQTKWYHLCPGEQPSGCKVTVSLPKGANLFRMSQHPDAHFISIIWQASSSVCPSVESKWARSCGTEFFDDQFRFLGPASSYSGHQDVGFDVNGDPIWIGNSNSGTAKDYRALEVVNLKTLDPTRINAKHILLPCTFSYIGAPGSCDSGTYIGYAKSWHVSMTAWSGRPGWALFSTFMLAGQSMGAPRLPAATTLGSAVAAAGAATVAPPDMSTIAPGVLSLVEYGSPNSEMVTWSSVSGATATATFTKPHPASAAVQCVSCGNTGFAAAELLALKVDASAADWSEFSFYRIARTHSIRDANYNCEAHAAANRDFTAVVFGSSWDGDCDSNTQVTGYWVGLKHSAPPLTPACTLKVSGDGRVIEDLHCTGLPVVDSVSGRATDRSRAPF